MFGDVPVCKPPPVVDETVVDIPCCFCICRHLARRFLNQTLLGIVDDLGKHFELENTKLPALWILVS